MTASRLFAFMAFTHAASTAWAPISAARQGRTHTIISTATAVKRSDKECTTHLLTCSGIQGKYLLVLGHPEIVPHTILFYQEDDGAELTSNIRRLRAILNAYPPNKSAAFMNRRRIAASHRSVVCSAVSRRYGLPNTTTSTTA